MRSNRIVFSRRRAIGAGLIAIAILGLLAGFPLRVRAADPGSVHVHDAWARPSIGKTGRSAAYFAIANHAAVDDRLVETKGDVADRIEMHENVMDGDVMRMRALPKGVEVPAGKTVTFEPAGMHVMLIGLKKPLKVGDSFPLTLVFEKAGEIKVDVAVTKTAAGGEMHHKH